MLRRQPTAIELTLDDVHEYEVHCEKMAKEQEKQKGFKKPVNWTGVEGKSKEEIHARIGYVPDKPSPSQQRTLNLM